MKDRGRCISSGFGALRRRGYPLAPRHTLGLALTSEPTARVKERGSAITILVAPPLGHGLTEYARTPYRNGERTGWRGMTTPATIAEIAVPNQNRPRET